MTLVVDASAVAAIVWGEPEGEELAAYLDGETLIAPPLLDFEIVNIALKKLRRRLNSPEGTAASLVMASRMPISRVATPAAEVFALAYRTGLTAYDASYLWLARSRDIELVTLDRKLAKFVREDYSR
jgi:predicted nucleic acid-binding protein